MIDRIIGKQCTGCTACFHLCPKGAITLNADTEGSKYPCVDEAKCVNCAICKAVCPVLNGEKEHRYENPTVYAAWNLDDEIRRCSTSGGVFSAMAQAFMAHGGYVSGAVYGADFEIFHIVTNKFGDISRLRQSKYAQSNMENVFPMIKTLLDSGEKVLFVGSPCQSAGLQNYLRKDYSTLYTCDFICRGVISQKVYQKFLRDMEKKKNASLVQVQFKNKDFGWNRFSTKLSFTKEALYQKDRNEDAYMVGYLKHNLYLRPSCHQCKFKRIPRQSDISLGDFWGVGNYKRELDTDRGTSVVLVNSSRGKELLEWMQSDLYIEERELQEVIAGNACVLSNAPEGRYRKYFFQHFEEEPFDELVEKIDRKVTREHWSWKDWMAYCLCALKNWFK